MPAFAIQILFTAAQTSTPPFPETLWHTTHTCFTPMVVLNGTGSMLHTALLTLLQHNQTRHYKGPAVGFRKSEHNLQGLAFLLFKERLRIRFQIINVTEQLSNQIIDIKCTDMTNPSIFPPATNYILLEINLLAVIKKMC